MISPVLGKSSVSERLSQARRAFLRLIPRQLASEQKRSASDFTRNRQLPNTRFRLPTNCVPGSTRTVDWSMKAKDIFRRAWVLRSMRSSDVSPLPEP